MHSLAADGAEFYISQDAGTQLNQAFSVRTVVEKSGGSILELTVYAMSAKHFYAHLASAIDSARSKVRTLTCLYTSHLATLPELIPLLNDVIQGGMLKECGAVIKDLSRPVNAHRAVYGEYVVRLATLQDRDQLVGPVSEGIYGQHDYYPRVATDWLSSAPLPSMSGIRRLIECLSLNMHGQATVN